MERLLREVNGQIYRLTQHFDGASEYVCECGRPDCHTMLPLLPAEFAALLEAPGHRLVAAGHDAPDAVTIREGNGYLVVAERGPVTATSA